MSHEGSIAGDGRRRLLKAAVYLLGYPDDDFAVVLGELRPDLERMPQPAAALLVTAISALQAVPAERLAASYVATFDFSEARALYLTAHELGDSRRRGQALLDLRALLRAEGFEPAEGELPDYLPMLLEFLSAAPEGTAVSALERRVARVCEQIHSELAADDLYRPVFEALRTLLPTIEPATTRTSAEAVPSPPPRRSRFPLHERADTAELPYPLRYEE